MQENRSRRSYPKYTGGSILNLAASLSEHFGVACEYPPLAADLPLDGAESVVLLIVDALGHRQLHRHLTAGQMPELSRLLSRGGVEVEEVTSVFPSTTAAALTTLHTAAPPAATGMLGYNLWLPEVGAVSNMISFRDLERGGAIPLPERLKTVPSLYSRLTARGVACRTVNSAEFAGTALTRWHFEGAEYLPYERVSQLPGMVARAAAEPGYTVAYWPGYDTTCHHYGTRSRRAAEAVRVVDRTIGELFLRLRGLGATLLITADHGQRDLSPRKAALLNDDPYLKPRITAPPTGERSSRYFHSVNGSTDELARHLRGAAEVVPSAEAWEYGLFGGPPAREEFRQRTGDLLAVTRSAWQLNWAFHPSQRRDFHRGGHGGWSPEEMFVPVISART